MEQFRRAQMGMAAHYWDPSGQFQTPYWQGPAGGAAGATPEMLDYMARAGGLQGPNVMGGPMGDQMRAVTEQSGIGYRDPNTVQYNPQYQQQNFQVGGLDFANPFPDTRRRRQCRPRGARPDRRRAPPTTRLTGSG